MAKETVGAPAILLIISGVVGLLYSVGYLVWQGLPLLMSLIYVISAVSEGLDGEAVGALFVLIITPLVQTVLYLGCLPMAIITLWGGLRFRQYRSKGLVWLAILCSSGTPLLGAIATSASMLNCGSLGIGLLGCLFGNLLTVPVLILGVVASVVGIVVLSDPNVADRFNEASA